MPNYDYVCSACHRLTEVVHGIAAEGPRFCPECGAEGTMKKVITAPSVHFKGSGWAKKDRGSSSRAAARSKEDGGSGDGKKDAAVTTESSGSSGDRSTSGDDRTPSKKADDTNRSTSGSNAGSGTGSSSGSGD